MKKLILPLAIISIILVLIGYKWYEFKDITSDSYKEQAQILNLKINAVEGTFYQPLEDIKTLVKLKNFINPSDTDIINSNRFMLVRKDYNNYEYVYLVANHHNKSPKEVVKSMIRMNKINFFEFLFKNDPIIIDSIYTEVHDICKFGVSHHPICFYKNQKFKLPPMNIFNEIDSAFLQAVHNNQFVINTKIGKKHENMDQLFSSYTVLKADLKNPENIDISILCSECNEDENVQKVIDSLTVYLNNLREPEFNKMDSIYIHARCILPSKDDL